MSIAGSPDPDVLAAAQSLNAILITGDRDFLDLRDFPVGTHSGIVVLRIPDTVSYRRKIERLLAVINDGLADEVAGGSLAVVTMTRVRFRRA
jgi:predicted nuclease of predicted toxin-antitoxin system